MKAISAYKTDVGRQRQKNQDHLWVDDEAGIYIVADGVGGKKAGEVASAMAAEHVGQFIISQLQHQSSPIEAEQLKTMLIHGLETANQTIHNAGQEDENLYEMRTTLVVVVLNLPRVYICHAGDSRAYRLKKTSITPLTTDDVWFVGGKLRSILTKAVGQPDPLEPQFIELTIVSDEWLLLCSDGLWDMVDDETILNHVNTSQTPAECVEKLVNAANQAGGKDNISVIAIKIIADDEAVR